MFYTSGTTGKPKGVRRKPMQPEQLAASARVGALAYGIRPDDDQVILMNGPMYHSAPHSYGMLAFRHRCTIVLEPRFDPEDMLRLIERHHVTHMHMVPTMFVRLLKLPEEVRRRYDLSSLRFVVHGAAPCPPEVKRAMIDWWGLVINEYFGSTETGIPVWHSASEALAKPGTVGRAIDGGIVKIFRADGTPCGVNEPGEIFMRQMAVSDFDYHDNAQARAEAGRDGLLSVGDVGYLDQDGYLILCDRKRDMVISGGVNIYPAEIESVLNRHAGGARLGCAGVPSRPSRQLQGSGRNLLSGSLAARSHGQDFQAQAARALLASAHLKAKCDPGLRVGGAFNRQERAARVEEPRTIGGIRRAIKWQTGE
jgi:long-chain acyl-CoA synthetase